MLDVIKKRRSIRIFQDKEVEQEKVEEVLKAASFAPSAHDCRSWEFVVVKDKRTKELLSKIKKGAEFTKYAPLVIVLCADENKDPRWVEDLSIAAAHIYLEATNQGLATCFVQIRAKPGEEYKNYEGYIRKVIGAPDNIRILNLMPLGYPGEKLPEHGDNDFNPSQIHQGKW